MSQHVIVGIEWQQDPRTMEVRRFYTNTCVDQHLCRFDTVGLDGNAGCRRTDAGKHLATDLPRIMSTPPRVRALRARKGPANRLDSITITLRHEALSKSFDDDETRPPNDRAMPWHRDV